MVTKSRDVVIRLEMEKSEKGIFAFIDYENNSIQDFKKGFFAQAIVAQEAFFI